MPEAGRQLRVMHVIGRLIPGGVERRTLELIRYTRSSEIQHHVLVTSGLAGSLDQEYRSAGAKIHYLPLRGLAFAGQLMRLLRQQKIDVLHSNIMYASGYVLMLARIVGVQGRIAHFQSDGQRRNLSWRKRLQYSVSRGMIDAFATQIVGLTPEGLSIAWSSSWRNDPRCRVLVNGVLLAAFATSVRTTLLAPAEVGPVFIHLGRGDLPTKNREKAISIFGELAARYPNSILAFVGRDGIDAADGERHRLRLLSLLSSQVSRSRVRFIGEVDNVADYLAAADLFVFTSRLEGLPGVVIEAFASGLPVVASSLPGVRFIAENLSDEAAVRLLSPDDSDLRWADAIEDVLAFASDRGRDCQASRLNGGPFDLKRAAEAYLALWRDAAA